MHIPAFFGICSFAILSSVISLIPLQAWLLDTGLYYFSNLLTLIKFCSIFLFAVLTICGGIFSYRRLVQIRFFIIGLSVIGILMNCYIGIILVIDPQTYINGIAGAWINSINTKKIMITQRKLKCCGFHKVNEIIRDRCRESKTVPCLQRIMDLYSDSLRIGGYEYLSEALCFFLIACFLSMHGTADLNKKNEKSIAPMIFVEMEKELNDE